MSLIFENFGRYTYLDIPWFGSRPEHWVCYHDSSCGDNVGWCNAKFWAQNCGYRCIAMRPNQELFEAKMRVELEMHAREDLTIEVEMRYDFKFRMIGPLRNVVQFLGDVLAVILFPLGGTVRTLSDILTDGIDAKGSVILKDGQTSIIITVPTGIPEGYTPWWLDIFDISIPFPCRVRFLCLKYTLGKTDGLLGSPIEYCRCFYRSRAVALPEIDL
jgi:hypothetical protein